MISHMGLKERVLTPLFPMLLSKAFGHRRAVHGNRVCSTCENFQTGYVPGNPSKPVSFEPLGSSGHSLLDRLAAGIIEPTVFAANTLIGERFRSL